MSDNGNSSDRSDAQSLRDIPLSLDAILYLLANRRRRALLEFLWEQPDHVGSFEEATDRTILTVGRTQGSQPNHDDVRVDLLHHHLPKLADAGVIEYDIGSQTIRYVENERLETAYERVHDLELE